MAVLGVLCGSRDGHASAFVGAAPSDALYSRHPSTLAVPLFRSGFLVGVCVAAMACGFNLHFSDDQ